MERHGGGGVCCQQPRLQSPARSGVPCAWVLTFALVRRGGGWGGGCLRPGGGRGRGRGLAARQRGPGTIVALMSVKSEAETGPTEKTSVPHWEIPGWEGRENHIATKVHVCQVNKK